MKEKCDKCGAEYKIETDDQKYAAKRIEEFKKEHEKCKEKK